MGDMTTIEEVLTRRRRSKSKEILFPKTVDVQHLAAMISAVSNRQTMPSNTPGLFGWEDDFGLIDYVLEERITDLRLTFFWEDDPMFEVVKRWL